MRGKMGEYSALSNLSTTVKMDMRPLVMLPAIERDKAGENPKRSLSEHLEYHALRIAENWGPELPIYVDVRSVDGETTDDGEEALTTLHTKLLEKDIKGIPAATLIQAQRLSSQLRDTIQASGLCLILKQGDFDDDFTLEKRVESVLSALRVEPSHVDLLIDCGSFQADQTTLVTSAAVAFISVIPHVEAWRSLIFAATAFPQRISDEVDSNSIGLLPRSEWKIWRSLQKRNLPRKPTFADYIVDNPDAALDFIPGMQVPVTLRYTTEEDWLILKGGTIQNPGNEQFYDLCKQLTQRPEFKGEHYSWGDEAIYRRSHEQEGPGNPQIWRKIAVNHHMTLVTRQLSSFDGS